MRLEAIVPPVAMMSRCFLCMMLLSIRAVVERARSCDACCAGATLTRYRAMILARARSYREARRCSCEVHACALIHVRTSMCIRVLIHAHLQVLTLSLALSFDMTQASRNIQKTMNMHKENTFTLRVRSCKKVLSNRPYTGVRKRVVILERRARRLTRLKVS